MHVSVYACVRVCVSTYVCMCMCVCVSMYVDVCIQCVDAVCLRATGK